MQVMVVAKATSDEEAVQLANMSAFGLGSSVWAADQSKARRLATQVNAGMVSLNDFATYYMNQSLPFGGIKDSGFERFAGELQTRGE